MTPARGDSPRPVGPTLAVVGVQTLIDGIGGAVAAFQASAGA